MRRKAELFHSTFNRRDLCLEIPSFFASRCYQDQDLNTGIETKAGANQGERLGIFVASTTTMAVGIARKSSPCLRLCLLVSLTAFLLAGTRTAEAGTVGSR